jgi:anti-sigma factor RsiW
MRVDAILDLLLLDADGALPPADAVRLEAALAQDPTLQVERMLIRAAWRELQTLASGVAMPRDPDHAEDSPHRDSVALKVVTTSTRRAPTNRDHSPARRRRGPPREHR